MKTPNAFMEYFRQNYPGPGTIISKPDWHAPKIYAVAIAASAHDELLEACKLFFDIHTAGCSSVQQYREDLEKARNMARDAIAKAEGAK